MNKRLKIVSIVLILVSLIMIVLPTTANAEIINGAGKYENFSYEIKSGRAGYGDSFCGLRYSNVYCVEAGQFLDFRDNTIFTKKYKFTLNGETLTKYTYSKDKDGNISYTSSTPSEDNNDACIKFAKGLAYIFSLENSIDRKKPHYLVRNAAINDPLQLALHAYIDEYASAPGLEDFFCVSVNNHVEVEDEKIKQDGVISGILHEDGTITYEYDTTDDEWAKIAYGIFEEAGVMKDSVNQCTFELYCYESNKGDNQNLYFVKESNVDETPSINLTINKTDEEELTISGAEFDVKIENLGGIKGYSIVNNIVNFTQSNVGTINLQEIKGNGSRNNIKITLTETAAPSGYIITNATTTIEIKQDCSQYSINNGEWVNTSSGATITVNIPNQPAINLSGNVWQDAQIGEKVVSGADGVRNQYYKYNKVNDGEGDYTAEYDDEGNITFTYVGAGKGNYTRVKISEGFLDGVLVELYNADANENKTGNKVAYTTTKNGGEYEFKDIPKTANGYIVVFKYDGINYKATAQNVGNDESRDSDVTEQNRNTINNNIKTISANSANGTVPLSYKGNEPILNVNMDGTNPANNNATDFQVEAHTGVYKDSNSNITCGLVKKELDLAVGTDVKEATLKINEKETKYTYAQIMNGEMEDLSLDDILQNNSSSNNKYNLYLYSSDYNYRIADYNTGITNNVNSDSYDYTADSTLKELEAYVTYSVILKNQTTYNATVDEFVYYYDSIYTPYNIVSTDKYDVQIDTNARKITFTSINNQNENISKKNGLGIHDDNDYRVTVDLTFKLDINSDAYKNLIDTSREAKNVVEITKYSTDIGGLIDKDSAPGNANVTFTAGTPTVGKYEDDTDEAKGITISVGNKGTRTITGTVFDDKDKDGILNNEDTVANDVIVQLIEIKKINGTYYEYIWQETRSGSNQVKTTARNGYTGETYTNNVQEGRGQYEFKDYIAGNYIIRFIYGDGSTYDLTDNVKTYNGQDYKSTVDANYQATWYNTAGYTADENGNYPSVARDNEARRLEVMAYSSTIDATNGEELERRSEEDLEKTWMAAETSRINIPVDGNTNTEDSATSSDTESIVSFANVNFGLALRPETKLVLEKHITGLKITPSGTGVQPIVDARADIEQIINGNSVDTTGITEGLSTMKSDRIEIGFWKVETDIEELAQGAELEVEYTYVIRNESDEDYLSNTLVEAYKSQDLKAYSVTLGEIRDTVKNTMRNGTYSYGNNNVIGTYLGQYYYTGTPAESDTQVLSRVEELEEALNNQLKYDAETSGEDFTKVNTESVSRNVYDTDGNLVDNVANQNKNIETVVKTTSATDFLTRVKQDEVYHDDTILDENNEEQEVVPNADYSNTLKLTTVLTSFNGGEGYYPSYIAEITKYSNAAGRRNMSAEPANLSYVHSEDKNKTIETNNEVDEFWGERIMISKPTGFNKQLAIQIAIVAISSIAVIGAGIVLIKKFVLKK